MSKTVLHLTWDNILHVYSLYRVFFMVYPNLNLQILKCACMHIQYSTHVTCKMTLVTPRC